MIVSKIKPLEMNKMEKVGAGANRTVETAAIEFKANHMTLDLISHHTLPHPMSSSHCCLLLMSSPGCNLGISPGIKGK
jgi:hypothetical protein